MSTYIANRASSDSNVLYPDMLDIEHGRVVYYKGHVFGYRTIVISRANIASVSLSSGIFFADVIIASNGGEIIRARGFSKATAKEILRKLI